MAREKNPEEKSGSREAYGDIIDLPRWEPNSRHPRMSLHDRAAQFAPFAALVGYDEMVEEEARLTEREIHPGEEDLEHLDRQFRSLLALLSAGQKSPVSVKRMKQRESDESGILEHRAGRHYPLFVIGVIRLIVSGA